MTTTNFPWENSPLVAPPTLLRLSIGGRTLLFCEARQILFELNPSADRIWTLLAEGRSPLEVCRELVELGVTDNEARTFIEQSVSSWIKAGHLVPRDVLARLSQPPFGTRKLRIHELNVAIRFFGDVPVSEVDAVFEQFAADVLPQAVAISIVSSRGWMFLFEAGSPLGCCGHEEFVPQLKAILTERYTACAREGFLVHAALVVRDDKTILISGAPGSGKTTLCVALAQSGFDYHGDDIVRIETDGRTVGTPFAACVKSAAWPLVEVYAPEIVNLAMHRRGDGRDVKYLPMPVHDQRPRSIDFVLLLSRQQGAPAALETVEPLEAFSALLQSAYSAKGAISGPLLTTFASAIESAETFRFVYSGLPAAIECIEEMLRKRGIGSRAAILRVAG